MTSRVRNRSAVIQLKQGQYDEARKSLEKNLKNDKRYSNKIGAVAKAEDLNDLAVAKYYLKDFDGAIKDLSKSLKYRSKKFKDETPQFAATYLNLSYVYARVGDDVRAIDFLVKATKLLNLNLESRKTVEDYQKSFDTTPRFPEAINNAFQKMVKSNNPEYEAPTYDTRANLLLSLLGRN